VRKKAEWKKCGGEMPRWRNGDKVRDVETNSRIEVGKSLWTKRSEHSERESKEKEGGSKNRNDVGWLKWKLWRSGAQTGIQRKRVLKKMEKNKDIKNKVKKSM